MIQYTIQVEGMACGMCETHVNDAVCKNFPVKKVSSSHSKGQTVVMTETELDENQLASVIAATGCRVGAIRKETAEKKGLFSRFLK